MSNSARESLEQAVGLATIKAVPGVAEKLARSAGVPTPQADRTPFEPPHGWVRLPTKVAKESGTVSKQHKQTRVELTRLLKGMSKTELEAVSRGLSKAEQFSGGNEPVSGVDPQIPATTAASEDAFLEHLLAEYGTWLKAMLAKDPGRSTYGTEVSPPTVMAMSRQRLSKQAQMARSFLIDLMRDERYGAGLEDTPKPVAKATPKPKRGSIGAFLDGEARRLAKEAKSGNPAQAQPRRNIGLNRSFTGLS